VARARVVTSLDLENTLSDLDPNERTETAYSP